MTKEPIFRLTRRRALSGLLVVGAGSAAAGAGTFALFSDTEDSTGNTLTAGTLTLDPAEGSEGLSFLTDSNIKPTDSGSDSATLENTGSIDGDLTISITHVDDTPLAEQLAITLSVGGDVTDATLKEDTGNNYSDTDAWGVGTLSNDDSATFTVDWEFLNDEDEDDFDNNDAQGETFQMDFEFELVQST